MTVDDQDALAAEYVLGTLEAEERAQVEAKMSADAGFAAMVRAWERRLGDLHMMVEPVEPPVQVWDKIKAEIATAAPAEASEQPSDQPLPAASPRDSDAAPVAEKPEADRADRAEPGIDRPPPVVSAAEAPSAQVIDLARRLRRWQGIAAAVSAVAAVLALFVAVREFTPVPPLPQPKPVVVTRAPGRQLVAMLQKEPGAPAFLLTVDLENRTLVVRRVEAEPQDNKSYELWLVSKQFPAPRSLGVVGAGEFTRRTTLAAYSPAIINHATYAISLEPQGGSPTGVPTGPVLFTGKLIEATPPAVPPPGG